MSHMSESVPDWPQIDQIQDFFRSEFRTFWLAIYYSRFIFIKGDNDVYITGHSLSMSFKNYFP